MNEFIKKKNIQLPTYEVINDFFFVLEELT